MEEQLANGVKAGNKSFFKYIRSKEPAKKSAGPRDGKDVRETLCEEKVTRMNYLHYCSPGELHAVPVPELVFRDGVWEAFQTEASVRSIDRSKSPEPGGFNWGDSRSPVTRPRSC